MVLSTTPGFELGPLYIYYYGIVYAAGALALYVTLLRQRGRLGLSERQVDSLLVATLLGLIIGGRLMHFIVNEPSIFITNPLELVLLRHGGMSFFGALLGIGIGVWAWYRAQRRQAWRQLSRTQTLGIVLRALDVSVIVASIALIFGRIANFLNQELVGTLADPSRIWWCIEFATATGCRHPYQLYAAASHLLLAALIFFVWHAASQSERSAKHAAQTRASRDGLAFSCFLAGYGILRFITDFWRDDGAASILGVSVWQLFALAIAAAGVAFWRICRKSEKEHGSVR